MLGLLCFAGRIVDVSIVVLLVAVGMSPHFASSESFDFGASMDASTAGFGAATHVVVIGVDGVGLAPLHEELEAGHLPTFSWMRANGAFTDSCRSVQPSRSGPNWAAILMGSSPSVNGVHFNGWKRDTATVQPIDGKCTFFPNLFSVARAQRPGATLAAFYTWEGIDYLLQPAAHLNVSLHTSGDEQTVDLAIDYFRSHRPELLFLHFDDVDHAGHRWGYGSHYASVLKVADGQIKRLLDSLQGSPVWEDTMVIVVSDHGRQTDGYQHGSFSDPEMTTQWIVLGAGVRRPSSPVQPLPPSILDMDTASTALHALGLRQPVQWHARPVLPAFAGAPAPWLYVEPLGVDEGCLADFHAQFPSFFQPESFGVGVGATFALFFLVLLVWGGVRCGIRRGHCLCCSRCPCCRGAGRDRRHGGRKRAPADFDLDLDDDLFDDDEDGVPLTDVGNS